MSKIFLLILISGSISGRSQSTDESEKKIILERVQLFFQSLEKQDTALYRSLFLPEAQGWSVRVRNDSIIYRSWLNAERVKTLINPGRVVEEKLLSYEIRVHQQIAIAWIPYTLSVSGKFSHCGVDLFTFIKTDQGWKINSCSFTVEPDGCDALKKE
ncbi:MAG TPA: nuclear transport factor 2 family protein [Chitinophagaceae bacterium]|nr:nuclear transport factor 2 family protein [Chitinophagaceae bacterium]